MKKYLFLMIALVGLVGMSGCSKDDDSYYNPNRTFIYTINQDEWALNNDGSFSFDISLPELTDYYVTDGFVSVAISVDGESSYEIIPTTVDAVAYSANYAVGSVLIRGQDPIIDPEFPVNPPQTVRVKIVLSDSDFVP